MYVLCIFFCIYCLLLCGCAFYVQHLLEFVYLYHAVTHTHTHTQCLCGWLHCGPTYPSVPGSKPFQTITIKSLFLLYFITHVHKSNMILIRIYIYKVPSHLWQLQTAFMPLVLMYSWLGLNVKCTIVVHLDPLNCEFLSVWLFTCKHQSAACGIQWDIQKHCGYCWLIRSRRIAGSILQQQKQDRYYSDIGFYSDARDSQLRLVEFKHGNVTVSWSPLPHLAWCTAVSRQWMLSACPSSDHHPAC